MLHYMTTISHIFTRYKCGLLDAGWLLSGALAVGIEMSLLLQEGVERINKVNQDAGTFSRVNVIGVIVKCRDCPATDHGDYECRP